MSPAPKKSRKRSRKKPSYLAGITKTAARWFLLLLVVFPVLLILRPRFEAPKWIYPDLGVRIPPGWGAVGFDVSHWQGRIQWDQVNSGEVSPEFVWMKVSEGTAILDDQYRRNSKGAGKVELRHGAYHYLHPNAGGAEQATYFLKHADLKSGELVPVLDIEENSGMSVAEVQQEVLDWLEGVSASCKCEPIIYCSRYYFETYFQTDKRFENHRFWVALYGRRQLELAEGDKRIILWQFSDQGQINGIPEKVDLNVLRQGLPLESLLIP